ncbi:MAG TPA: GTPase, partial [Desulfosarcina sp.]|nr:GTPase [Desulfosarcina sp.]
YDLIVQETLQSTSFDNNLIPRFEKLFQNARPIHVLDQGTEKMHDFAQVLQVHDVNNLLAYPVMNEEEHVIAAVVLVSPYSKHIWDANDQEYLKAAGPTINAVLQKALAPHQNVRAVENLQQELELSNAGKSTLIAALTAARPKVADYPFTTLAPCLGVVQTGRREPFVMADIPGLIEGAHAGTGLGIRFLRHVERTRVLVHLVDAAAIDPDHPLRDLDTVNRELHAYSRVLAEKPQLVVLNKMDVDWAPDAAALFTEAWGKTEPVQISAATGQGIEGLKSALCGLLDRLDDETTHNEA